VELLNSKIYLREILRLPKMVLPVVVYGDPVLRKTGVNIDKNYSGHILSL